MKFNMREHDRLKAHHTIQSTNVQPKCVNQSKNPQRCEIWNSIGEKQ